MTQEARVSTARQKQPTDTEMLDFVGENGMAICTEPNGDIGFTFWSDHDEGFVKAATFREAVIKAMVRDGYDAAREEQANG